MIEANFVEAATLPTLKLKNKVIFRDEKMILPFDIKQNEPTNLGLFLVNNIPETRLSLKGPRLKVSIRNGRHADIGDIIHTDTQNIIFNFVDFKGIGHIGSLNLENEHQPISVMDPYIRKGNTNSMGIWDKKTALRESELTEELSRKGLRTYRIDAVIELEQIATKKGEIISLKEARKRKLIKKDEVPVIGVRSFRLGERLQYLSLDDPKILIKSKKYFETEFKKSLTWAEYITLFTEIMADNMAILHGSGYYHSAVTGHNVTMAAELIDIAFESSSELLSSLSKTEAMKMVEVDLKDTERSVIKSLVYYIKNNFSEEFTKIDRNIPTEEELFLLFREKYKNKLLELQKSKM